jgi:hypothetical protein
MLLPPYLYRLAADKVLFNTALTALGAQPIPRVLVDGSRP